MPEPMMSRPARKKGWQCDIMPYLLRPPPSCSCLTVADKPVTGKGPLRLYETDLATLASWEDFTWRAMQDSQKQLPFYKTRGAFIIALATLNNLRMTYLWIAEEIVRKCEIAAAKQKAAAARKPARASAASAGDPDWWEC